MVVWSVNCVAGTAAAKVHPLVVSGPYDFTRALSTLVIEVSELMVEEKSIIGALGSDTENTMSPISMSPRLLVMSLSW